MKSPFPGMDPYIEDRLIWSDFHSDLAGEIRARLNAKIRPAYVAVLTPSDLFAPAGSATMALDPPHAESSTELEMPLELMSIEVRQVGTDRLITAIEILSPVNKQRNHEARIDYLRKRRELLRSQAHFIEIDLLRGGERTPVDTPVPDAPYYVSLSRVQRRPKLEVWTIHFDSRLPRIPVPLAEGDRDVGVDLGEVVASVYERGGYDARIDYQLRVPPPALTAEQAKVIKKILP